MIRLVLSVFVFMSCTHTGSDTELSFSGFPGTFLTEQTLTITTPKEKRQLRAQLQRQVRGGPLDLVLIEPMLGIVLARVSIGDNGVKPIHLAAAIDAQSLPLEQIGLAIRSLYEAETFVLDEADLIHKPDGGRYEYRLQSIRGSADCRYPAQMGLQFAERAYTVVITTESFTCTLE